MPTSPAAPRATLRNIQKQATLERLLVASREAFRARGYAATIDEIAVAASASRGTFYLHFRSKGHVLARLYHDDYVLRLTAWLHAFPECSDLLPLQEWIKHYMGIYTDNKSIITAWNEAGVHEVGLYEETNNVMDEFLEELAAKVLQLRKSNGHNTQLAEARVRGSMMYSQMQNTTYFQVVRKFDQDADTQLNVLAEMWQSTFGRTLRPPAADR